MRSYSSKEIIKLLTDRGWCLARVEGSHHIFRHGTGKGIVTVPHPKKDLPLKTAASILRQAGIPQKGRKP
ncbi:MAG: type II toxin-antitoxin system HicA family toxin [Oscillospiraceae bacterium]|nr:type II toxin-antitoxin system HicA family toxin [Oscillospiraceae bacterium]